MNDLLDYLLAYAKEHQIHVFFNHDLQPDQPPFTYAKRSLIVMNANWHNSNELPFQLAHEIGHCVNGTVGVAPYATFACLEHEEVPANKTAIKLILRYCTANNIAVDNSYDFMTSFSVPVVLFSTLAPLIQKYINKKA